MEIKENINGRQAQKQQTHPNATTPTPNHTLDLLLPLWVHQNGKKKPQMICMKKLILLDHRTSGLTYI